jgi:hypothetical protein
MQRNGSNAKKFLCKILVTLLLGLIITFPALLTINFGSAATPTMALTPSSGPPGTTVTVIGSGFSASTSVNLSYTNPANSIKTLLASIQTDSQGQFTYITNVFDLKSANPAGDNPQQTNSIVFTAESNGTSATTNYIQNFRGLTTFASQTANGLFGDQTSFTNPLNVGQSLRLVSKWFYPGTATMQIDTNTITQVTVNTQGSFDTTITIPALPNGTHSISIVDANNVIFKIFFEIRPFFSVTPTEGFVGSTIIANGYGFPATDASNNYTILLEAIFIRAAAIEIGNAQIDNKGSFQYQFSANPFPSYSISATVIKNPGNIRLGEFSERATFDCYPTLTLTPSSGSASTLFALKGDAFSDSRNYTVSWNNQTLSTFRTATKQFSFEENYAVPNVLPGSYLITVLALDYNEVEASTTFIVTSAPTPTTTPTPSPTPTPTISPTPTPIPTPEVTSTPNPTATTTSTPTPTPTSTPTTPAITATPSPTMTPTATPEETTAITTSTDNAQLNPTQTPQPTTNPTTTPTPNQLNTSLYILAAAIAAGTIGTTVVLMSHKQKENSTSS